MNQKKVLITISLLLIVSLSVIGYLAWSMSRKQVNVVYVDNSKLFAGYEGKKEIEKKFEEEKNKDKNLLDSLKGDLIITQQKYTEAKITEVQRNVLAAKQQNYQKLYYQIEDVIKKKDDEYTGQIWTQITQYVKDYGKKRNYDFIFGASGNGNLMYANTGKDVTSDVLKYINQKYEGK